MPAVHRLTALELVGLLARGELSPGELRDHYLSRIQRYNPQLSCYLHVASERLAERYPVAGMAVFGRRVTEAAVLQDGDRLELLRVLAIDPKEARRRRAETAQAIKTKAR